MKEAAALVQRDKLPFRHERGWGQVLTLGQGDTGDVQGVFLAFFGCLVFL